MLTGCADDCGEGRRFSVGQNPLRLNSPCLPFVKPGVLAVCLAPHQYLSGAALSPPACIYRQLRPNDASSACTDGGVTDPRSFHPFHLERSDKMTLWTQ